MLKVAVKRTVEQPQYQVFETQVQLYGFDKLTPRAARAAIEIAFGQPYGGEVWMEAPATEQGIDYSQMYGYRVYKNSARKVWADQF